MRLPGSHGLAGYGCRAFVTRDDSPSVCNAHRFTPTSDGSGLDVWQVRRGTTPVPSLKEGGELGSSAASTGGVCDTVLSLPAGRKGMAPLLQQGGAGGGPFIPYHQCRTNPSHLFCPRCKRETNRQALQTRDSRTHLTRDYRANPQQLYPPVPGLYALY
jgi:hypothetical protein